MRAVFKRPPGLFNMPRTVRADIRRTVSGALDEGLRQFQRALTLTPVYTGRTLANYRWSLGEPITDLRSPIKTPALPGKTSEMQVGSEPRRAANQALIQSEFLAVLKSVLANPFQNVYLTNNVPNFDSIEYGSYSENSRTPVGGMTRRGELQLTIAIKGIVKRG